jgi:hypothetical protein
MSEIAIDLSVLFFALGVSMVTGVLFGLAPVAQGLIIALYLFPRRAADCRNAAGCFGAPRLERAPVYLH